MGVPGGLLDHARNGDKGADRFITLLAAGGSLEAQRDLLTLLVGEPACPEHRQLTDLSFEEAVRVEILARFCAMRGNDLDTRRLAGVLCHMAATTPRADDRLAFSTEAAGLLRKLADEGDGVASDFLAKVVADFPESIPALRVADAALTPTPDALPVPPPIIFREGASLGDILAEAFGYEPRTGFLGLVDSARFHLSEVGWSIRGRWWALKDKLGLG